MQVEKSGIAQITDAKTKKLWTMDKLDRRLDQVILQSSHFQTRIQVQIIHAYFR